MRAIAISLAVHAAVVIVLATRAHSHSPVVRDPEPIEVAMISDVVPPTPPSAATRGGGGGTSSRGHAQIVTRRSAWDDVSISREGNVGTGGGVGGGHGHGIGFGDGDGIAAAPADVPAPPQPAVSHARPARLLVPMRQEDVDDAELFVARVTIDESGDVAGVYMVRTHPGSRGELAESAIWTFHYDPARDDAGKPTRSTFEQPFAIR